MPPEARQIPAGDWLLALLRAHLRGDSGLPAPPEGDDLAKVAEAEGLAGLAAEYVPPESPAFAALLQRRRTQFAFAAKLGGLQRSLGRAFAAAGCEAMLLKGAALLEGPYRGAKGRRPLSDLDLLIHPGQAAAVAGALSGLGLRCLDPSRWRGDGFEIDLHTDLLGMEGQGLAARSPFRVDEAALWRRSRPAREGGPGLRVPETIDQILHLAIHGQKRAFCRLIWLLDLALLLPGTDTAALLERAREWRAERALAAALLLLADPLGVEIPTALRALPSRLNAAEEAWLAAIRRRPPGRPLGLGRMIAGFALPGLGDRLLYWWRVAWPGGRLLARRYGRGSPARALFRHLRESLWPRLREALAVSLR